MKNPVKLGPLALLLTVISICMTTLAILTVTTARADLSLANTYAGTVQRRYELEIRGQEFLRDLEDENTRDSVISQMDQGEDGILYRTCQMDGSRLLIGIRQGPEDSFSITAWRHERDWVQDESIGNLWLGD